MSGQLIKVRAHDGGRFPAYLSLPPSGSGPGLLVLQEIFGVNAHIRAVTDRWAAEGYVALAPDIFWRVEPGVELPYTAVGIATGRALRQKYIPDFILFGKIVLEIKAVSALDDEHRAQVHNYLKATGYRLGLLVNFGHYPKLEWERIVR